ncbi:MAG TPA: phytoene desaturase family protein [Beutenbergiaceae bacterium]|nr:phytoene desaturase family protein [Beutenbergiaceae bacterium]
MTNAPIKASPVPGTPTRVAIIGAGVAGLASAALLARAGYQVQVFEKHDEPGGRTGRWEADGFRFDTGPSWLLMREVFAHFYALLGRDIDAELPMRQLDPAYQVFFEATPGPLTIQALREANQATFESLEPGAGDRLGRYLDSAERTYDLAIQRFLYTYFSHPAALAHPGVVARIPQLVRLLGQSLQGKVHSEFTDPRIRQVLGFPAVFLGTSPQRAPSMYHLMSALDLSGGVYYPEGGMYALIDSLVRCAQQEGAQIHTGARVERIRTEVRAAGLVGGRRRRRVRGVQARIGDQVRKVDADVVVGAGDITHLERLLPPPARRPPSYWERRDPGLGGVLAMLGVRGRVPQLQHHSLFFTADWEENFAAIFGPGQQVPDPASIYVCAPSRTDPTCAPEGMENLFLLIPVPADPEIGRGGIDRAGDPQVEAAADAAIDQMATWAGIPDLADRIVVRRTVGPGDFAEDLGAWSGSLLGPAHVLSQSAMWRTPNQSPTVAGLYYTGASTVPGVGLPMCLISAEVLLKRLRGDRTSGPLPAPLPDLPAAGR